MKKLSIEIRLDDPCTEDWDRMTPVEQGRYCASCQKTVIDMTAWSDQDFVNYFNSDRAGTCGRFDERQLNRRLHDHAPAPRKTPGRRKALALVLSFLALQSAAAKRATPPNIVQEALPGTDSGMIRISGLITDSSSNPIVDAEITYNGVSYRSDAMGRYEIVLDAVEAKSGSVIFQHAELRPEVRSYSIAMRSAVFDIQLMKPGIRRFSGGAPIISFHLPEGSDFVIVRGKTLDSATKQALVMIAAMLQANPVATISLQSYYSRAPLQSVSRALLVKRFLSEKFGIGDDRMLVPPPQKSKSAGEQYRVRFLARDSW